MANLYVTLTEEITLPNNNVVNTNNFNNNHYIYHIWLMDFIHH